MLTHAYKIQTSEILNTELNAYCQPPGEVLSTKTAGYKVHSLLIYKWQTFPTLSTEPWNCPLLLNMLLTWIISAKSQHFLAICKGTGKPKLFLLSEGSLEDAPDPLKRHSKLGTSKQKCSSSLTQGEQAWK